LPPCLYAPTRAARALSGIDIDPFTRR
jgi:hypothetical protein